MTGARGGPATVDGRTTVRGAGLAWSSEGEGPLVVWGHGLSNDRWSMEDRGMVDWSPIAASGRRLLRLDWRGHGESHGDPDPAQYEWPSLADDLLALMDELSPDAPVAGIGNSMGTGAMLYAALRAPERFTHLVLTAPPTAWETRAAQAQLYEQLAALAESGGSAAVARAMAAFPPQGIFAELDDRVFDIRVADALLPSVYRGAARTDLPAREALRELAVPTLVLSWYGDPGHPVSTGEALHELIPGARFAVAESLTEVQAWGEVAASFIAEVRS